MPIQVLLHIENTDPVLGEIENLPATTDLIVTVKNPRLRDGKDLHFLSPDVVTVIWPVNKINFIEILPSEEEERIIGFVRE